MSRVLIWGFGRFGGGLASCLHLHRRGHEVALIDRLDRRELEPGLDRLREAGGPGDPELLREEPGSLRGAELLVVNPAIPPSHPLLHAAEALGIPRTQEVELFLRAYPGRVHALTGTHGKSTTASLLARGHCALGRDCLLGGNIGHSLLLDEERWSADQVAVLELSSFQTERLEGPYFDALSLTPIQRDHLAWHGGLEAYHRAKLRTLRSLREGARAWALPGGLAGSIALPGGLAGSIALPGVQVLGGEGDRFSLEEDGSLCHLGRRILGPDQPALPGRALREALWLASESLAPEAEQVPELIKAWKSFEGLPHRLQVLTPHGHLRFVDNAISTTLETTLHAIEAIAGSDPGASLHLVCGGLPKDAGMQGAEALRDPCLSSLHLFGEAARRLAGRLGDQDPGIPVTRHGPLEEALDAACLEAERSGRPACILFSPAFASQDAYTNYAERAEAARRWWRSPRAERPAGIREQCEG